MPRFVCGILLLAGSLLHAAEPYNLGGQVIPLWPNQTSPEPEKWITHAEAVPGELPVVDSFHRVTNIHNPSLTVFLPPPNLATGAAFIVCPGGGHKYLLIDVEGSQVAQKLNSMGIAAFVLKNRLARAPGSTYKVDVESLADVQRAIRLVRSRAQEWHVDPNHIGVMGFSAGGELAALAETRFDQPAASTDPLDRVSARPDFVVLGYPGLRPANFTFTKATPPTFLMVNNDDPLSTPTAEYYLALRKAGVPAELHVFNRGGHGFGVNGRTAEFHTLAVARWPDLLRNWMVDMGFLKLPL